KEYVLPFSQVIECRNVCETDTVEVDFSDNCCCANLFAADDGSTFLKCDISVDVRLSVYRNIEGKLLLDMYSTEYETQVSARKVYITEGHTDYSVSVSARDKIDCQTGVGRIIDSRVSNMCTLRGEKVRVSLFVAVLYEDGLGVLKTARTVLDAGVDVPQNAVASTVVCSVDALSVTSEADGISVSAEATVCSKVIQGYFCDQVESCVLDTTQRRKKNTKGNLVLRYPEKDESVWSIAKLYGTTEAAIISANDMEDESQLTCGRLIIIPFVR
ncbi:MAG: LysM peptidoglycan-binding domain-containing protein, partial [Clostridia bacterium]|nr:LysM peptidoglycan-binding domain-containing protein [Clostridia bacterium]